MIINFNYHLISIAQELGYFRSRNLIKGEALTIFATKKNFGKWQDIFQDSVILAEILEQMLYHFKVIKIVGDSYRLKKSENRYLKE